MKKHVFAISVLTVIAGTALAQETIKVTNVAAGTAMTAPQNVQPVASVTTTTTTAAVQAPATTTVVAQAPAAVAPAPALEIVKQPVTVVEATPLTTSRAEDLRKQRENSEVETEQKIVEKLEESRMEAEKKRQAAILGSFTVAEAPKVEEKKAEVALAPAPVPVVVEVKAPAEVAAPQEKGANIDEVRAAVREELAASQKDIVPAKPEHTAQGYIRGTIGMLDYDSADIRTIGAAGVSFGKLYDDHWALEISALGASAYVDESNFLFRKMDQFNLGLGTRFIILTGRVRPSVGFLVDYVNRNYSELRDVVTGGVFAGSESGSWAVDYGLTAGLDIAITDNLNVGMEYRFMTNLTYEYNDEILNTPAYRSSIYGDWLPLEERDSSMLGFSIKYLF